MKRRYALLQGENGEEILEPTETELVSTDMNVDNTETDLVGDSLQAILRNINGREHVVMQAYSNDMITSQTVYRSNMIVNSNRLAVINYTYTDFVITQEQIQLFDDNGITVIKQITYTHTYDNDNLISTVKEVIG